MAVLVDTDSVAVEERAGYWRQALHELFDASVRVDCADERGYRGRLTIHRIDRIGVAELLAAPMSFSTVAGPGEDEILALAVSSGSVVVDQGGRQCLLNERQVALCSGSRPLSLALSTSARLVSVHVPEHEFTEMFPQGRHAALVPIAADAGAPALFLDQLDALLRRRDSLDEASAHSVADSMLHLLGAVACFAVVDNPNCAHRQRAKIDRVLRVARERLRDPDLGVDSIARAVHLSPRHVHRLFVDEPMSLMQWVHAQRLQNCRRELCRPDLADRPIGEIAYGWGFSDQAHFSRAFRKHFGESPSEVRRLALAPDAAGPSSGRDASVAHSDPLQTPDCRGCRFRTRKTSR